MDARNDGAGIGVMAPSQRPSWPEYRAGALIPGTDCAAVQKVGQGAQAEVYVVRHTFIGRVAAMKLWRSDVFTDQSFSAFRAEAVRQAAMNHPNIVAVTGGGMTGETPRRPYFLMDYHEGESLDRTLKRMQASDRLLRDEHLDRLRKGLPSAYQPRWATMRDAAEVCVQVCAALTHAHAEHGLLHRDIKPANVFLHKLSLQDAIAKLLDFGIAKLIDEALANPDRDFWGTLRYCAPEQVGGKACEQSDLYAVAGIFYELLCGAHVFAEAKTVSTLMQAVLKQPPVPISKRMGNVTPRLEQFFLKNLHKNPVMRAVSAREMAKEIRAIAAEYEDQDRQAAGRSAPSDTTERMPFQAALAMAAGPSEENLARARLDSVWDSATGTAVELGEAATAEENRAPQLLRGRAVEHELPRPGQPLVPPAPRGPLHDTDPVSEEEMAARARAVAAAIDAQRARLEEAARAAAEAERKALQAQSEALANGDVPAWRVRTVPMGPVLKPSEELLALEEQARKESAIRPLVRLDGPAAPAPTNAPHTREQTPEERRQRAIEREDLERRNQEEAARVRTVLEAKAQAMARQTMGLPPEPLAPPAKPAQIGDTNPSRVEPWDANMKLVAPSVKVVHVADTGAGSAPPPTENLGPADPQAQSTALLKAHLAKGAPASRHASTTPMPGAPGKVPARASAAGPGATVPFGQPVLSTPTPTPSPAAPPRDRTFDRALAVVCAAIIVVCAVIGVVLLRTPRETTPAPAASAAAPLATAPPEPAASQAIAPVSSPAASPPSAAPSANVVHEKVAPKVGPAASAHGLPAPKAGAKRAPHGESPNVQP